MPKLIGDWPNDADGDVFRRLHSAGFDFAKAYSVDYNVDFKVWPPAEQALEVLRSAVGDYKVYRPEDDYAGYVQFQISGPVTYEGVTAVQRRITAAVQNFGGVCESWGVLH